MEFKNIHVYKDGAIGVIKVNRPEVRNALDKQTIKEMSTAMGRWNKHEGVQIIMITGEGEKAFIAGADIRQLKKKTSLDGLEADLSMLCKKIEESSKISIAAINGLALGGGCEIALACDIRVAAEHAKLGFPELNLSIIPGGGGTQRLTRIVGVSRAKDMILTGDIIGADRAEQIGLLSDVVSLNELWETALKKATKMIQKGPLALRLAKLVIHEGSNSHLATGLTIEKLAQSLLLDSEDKQEGINAFLNKVDPNFKGK